MHSSRRKDAENAIVSFMAVASRYGHSASIVTTNMIATEHPVDRKLHKNLLRIDQVMRSKHWPRLLHGIFLQSAVRLGSSLRGNSPTGTQMGPSVHDQWSDEVSYIQRDDGHIKHVNDPTAREATEGGRKFV
jgi:hypothetical protein